MRTTGHGLHIRGMTQLHIAFDLKDPIERTEEKQMEKAHRFSTPEWLIFYEQKK